MANAKVTASAASSSVSISTGRPVPSEGVGARRVSSEADAVHFRGTGAEHHVLTIGNGRAGAARRALRRHRSGGGGRAAAKAKGYGVEVEDEPRRSPRHQAVATASGPHPVDRP